MSQKLKKNSKKRSDTVVDEVTTIDDSFTISSVDESTTSNDVKNTYLAGWAIPEQTIRLYAYELWQQNFSQDPNVNWNEAIRQIEQGLRV